MHKIMLKKLTIGVVFALMTIAFIWFARERSRSASVNCISHLRDIDAAKQNWALENNKTTNDVPSWQDLVPKYIHDKPQCPQGGNYTIGKVGEFPQCSYPGHKLNSASQ